MSNETLIPTPSKLLNRESRYIQSLHEAGFQMKEVIRHANPFNAILYKQTTDNRQQTTDGYRSGYSA